MYHLSKRPTIVKFFSGIPK